MNDSIKYGPVLGAALFILKWIENVSELYAFDLAFKIIVIASLLFFFLSEIKKRNQHFFPFKVAWLSGFNILVLGSLIHAALMVILRDLVNGEAVELKVGLYIAFIEFIVVEFLGTILSLIIGLIMKKKE